MDLRCSPQDVVLWAHTVPAQAVGGWEPCGAALTSPTSSVVCRGKIPDSRAQVFNMKKKQLFVYTLRSDLVFFCSVAKKERKNVSYS